MACRVRMTDLERRIIEHIFLADQGFEAVDDLLELLAVDQTTMVEALESLESLGFVSIANFAGTVVVSFDDPRARFFGVTEPARPLPTSRVVAC